MDHFFELTSSHAKAVFSSELASLARHPYVLIPDTKEWAGGGGRQMKGKPCQVTSNRSVRELGCQGCSSCQWDIAETFASKAVSELKISWAQSSLIEYRTRFVVK